MTHKTTRIFTSAALVLIGSCSDGVSTIEPTHTSLAPSPPPPPVQNADARTPSIARQWNELLLEAIREDFARPTVHARNLFHTSAVSYDLWAIYLDEASPYLLGETVAGFTCELDGVPSPVDLQIAREEAISFASYRLIAHRFANSPGAADIAERSEALMQELGYDTSNTSADYANDGPSALGNYAADCYIQYGLSDGSNEAEDYANQSYQPVNLPIQPNLPGNPSIVDVDRWQQIQLPEAFDQAGNPVNELQPFLGPEWGGVNAFALTDADKTTYTRGGFDYHVYFDPGAPPAHDGVASEQYKWGFSLVSIWSAHLDPSDGVMVDISPASVGNISSYPATPSEYDQFYDRLHGFDSSVGYSANPVTNQPYQEQIVPRGDYTRVLAEFWADGPDSETPPGHWFVILNEVNDHPDFARLYRGAGDSLGPLEWDVKSYFALGGAMHDSAIAAWGIKGWYDYIRPLSAIRAMTDAGQSSDPTLPSFSAEGIPLEPGYVELVEIGDPLAGDENQHVGKIKIYAWRGPNYIISPRTDTADVGWILAENWWPYQRPTFVTPPFAGYVSGHSTYSRAAAEVLTALTGDAFFPGGMSEFAISADDYLVFERGPSVDMSLQWATYRDAADQCSLSRIWGGIHPPADDIPGRVIGEQVGLSAFEAADSYFSGIR